MTTLRQTLEQALIYMPIADGKFNEVRTMLKDAISQLDESPEVESSEFSAFYESICNKPITIRNIINRDHMTELTVPIEFELTPASKELLALFARLQDSAEAPAPVVADASNIPPGHGEYWTGQGGFYICTLPALLGLPARHLIASKAEHSDLTFGSLEEISGATSAIDGPGNTKTLLAAGNHPAAKWASEQTADGHNDFHLPAKLDMVMAHICAPQLFNTSEYYWTSTQTSRYDAFVQDFENGNSLWGYKDFERWTRAFRWVYLIS